MKLNDSRSLAQSGLIAALYVVLTFLASAFGLASGAIQVRLSEMLCLLPCFTPAAIPGLFLGCILANIFTGAVVWDVVFGSLATLIGAVGTYLLRDNRWLAAFPPIIANVLIIPHVLAYAYGVETAVWLIAITVGAGEFLSAGVFGEILYSSLDKHRDIFQ